MLVVLSDLHFVEESSHYLEGAETLARLAIPVRYSHNLPARPFQQLAIRLADEAVRNKAERLDLVLAGDVFDLHRTAMWFNDNPTNERPYVAATPEAVNPALEALLIRIIDAIAKESMVAETLDVFKLFANGRYRDQNNVLRKFPVPITLHHIVGNHDRMGNATAAIRKRIRHHLGLPEDVHPFEHVLIFEQEQTLVRHGHEYDRYNFAHDHSKGGSIATNLAEKQYVAPAFGDFVTIDIASRLPYEFRAYHGEATIATTPLLRHLYLRLLEFDDLRPMAAMFNYFSHMPDEWFKEKEVWAAIEPVLMGMLDALYDDPYLQKWLSIYNKRWRLDEIDIIQLFLRLKVWRKVGVPINVVKKISDLGLKRARNKMGAETYAVREEGVKNGRFRFVVAGHTHQPNVSLLDHNNNKEYYFIDTGTWRNRIPVTADFKAFGRLKTLTYVTIYGGRENPGTNPTSAESASFDYWSGVTERWAVRKTAVSGI